jgi:hypothetical protein
MLNLEILHVIQIHIQIFWQYIQSSKSITVVILKVMVKFETGAFGP